jgi:predicted nucleic acid-binding protein
MAVIVKEPEREKVIQLTRGAIIASPNMVSYEIANGLTKMMKKKVIEKERMINAFRYYKKIPIVIKYFHSRIMSQLRNHPLGPYPLSQQANVLPLQIFRVLMLT